MIVWIYLNLKKILLHRGEVINGGFGLVLDGSEVCVSQFYCVIHFHIMYIEYMHVKFCQNMFVS